MTLLSLLLGVLLAPQLPSPDLDLEVCAARIYFEFDELILRASETLKLKALRPCLMASSARIIVEGHTDERRSEEYNLPLGDRLARVVTKALIRAGISPDRIEARSWGEERPLDPGHTETAWARNRRVEIRLASPLTQPSTLPTP